MVVLIMAKAKSTSVLPRTKGKRKTMSFLMEAAVVLFFLSLDPPELEVLAAERLQGSLE